MRLPLILRVRVWPWSRDNWGDGHIGLRRWVRDYRFTRQMHRNPRYVAAVARADERAAHWKATGQRPPTVDVADLIELLRQERA